MAEAIVRGGGERGRASHTASPPTFADEVRQGVELTWGEGEG
jgi:hypothetical protein